MNSPAPLGLASYTAGTREPPSLFRRPPRPSRPPSHGPLWPRGVTPSRGAAWPRAGARALNWRGGGSAVPRPPVVGLWPWHFVSETPFPPKEPGPQNGHMTGHIPPTRHLPFHRPPPALLAHSVPAAARPRPPRALECHGAQRQGVTREGRGTAAAKLAGEGPLSHPHPRTASGTRPRPHPAKFYTAL